MRMFLAVICGLWLTLSALPRPAHAETRYVSDQLVISVRAGTEANAALLTTLRTGTAVEVLREEGSHLRVRTEDGVEGYVQAQYITAETPKPLVIARLQAQVAKLQGAGEALKSLKADATGSEAALAEARRELQDLDARYRALLEKSEDVLQVIEERDRLQGERDRLSVEVETLRGENAALLRQGGIRWFLAGAGVLLAGWLVGKASRKKRRGYL